MDYDTLAAVHESEMKLAQERIAELELKNANALKLAVDEHMRAGQLEYRLIQVILAFDDILDQFVPMQGNLKVEQAAIVRANEALDKARRLCNFDETEPEPEDEDPEDEICSGCSGSGEGMWDGATCNKCHGSGTEPVEKVDEP